MSHRMRWQSEIEESMAPDHQAQIQTLKELLAQHVQDDLPEKNMRSINKRVDVVTVDASVCSLVANLLKFNGNVEQIDAFYRDSGVEQDFTTIARDARLLLEKITPLLKDDRSSAYFQRLKKMTEVAKELGSTREEDLDAEKPAEDLEEERLEKLRRTVDMDINLMEFRKKLKRDITRGPDQST